MTMRWTAAGLLLWGCGDPADDPEPTTGTTTYDSGTTTPRPPIEPLDVRLLVDRKGIAGPLGILVVDAFSGEAVLQSAPVDDDDVATLTLGEVPPEQVLAISINGTLLAGSLFRTVAFEDGDTNGEHGPGENLVGQGPDLFYIADNGVDLDVLAGLGFSLGWNLFGVGPGGSVPFDLQPPSPRATLSGSLADVSHRVATLPSDALKEPGGPFLFDDAITGDWTLTLDGKPPAAPAKPDWGPEGTVRFVPRTYVDANDNGVLDDGDEVGEDLVYCGGTGGPIGVELAWLPPTDDLNFFVSATDGQTGWVVVFRYEDSTLDNFRQAFVSQVDDVRVGSCD